jgi:hypothetical protein
MSRGASRRHILRRAFARIRGGAGDPTDRPFPGAPRLEFDALSKPEVLAKFLIGKDLDTLAMLATTSRQS